MYKKVSELSRNTKSMMLIVFDVVSLPVALWMGFALRLGEWWPQSVITSWWLFIAAPLIAVPIFIRMGMYRPVLRYVGSKALITIAKAISIVTLIMLALVAMLEVSGVPRSVFISFWLISLLAIGGGRIVLRGYITTYTRKKINKQPVAVYGAGSAGADLVKAMQSGWKYEPVALFDDDSEKKGVEIHGVKVFSPDHIPVLLEEKNISQILLAMPSLSPRYTRKILEKLEVHPPCSNTPRYFRLGFWESKSIRYQRSRCW